MRDSGEISATRSAHSRGWNRSLLGSSRRSAIRGGRSVTGSHRDSVSNDATVMRCLSPDEIGDSTIGGFHGVVGVGRLRDSNDWNQEIASFGRLSPLQGLP